MATTETMKEKIVKLLAKAEGTTNEHEAETFREAAEKLMVKWGIEQLDLEVAGKVQRDEIVHRVYDAPGIYGFALQRLASNIARGLGNLEVLVSKRSARNDKGKFVDIATVYIIGHTGDLDRFELLYNSLQLQAITAMNRWWKTSEERYYLKGMEAFKERRQFVLSFGQAVFTRLVAAREAEKTSGHVSHGAELVAVDKGKAVKAFTQAKFNPVSSRSRGVHGGGAGGRTAGHAAGMAAGLGGKGIGGARGQLGG